MAKDPIKKAENGTYYFRANLGFHPITGKQIQKYKSGFKTKKEAREAYSKLMLTSTEELTEKKQQLSFQQFIEETYLPWYKTQVKESTYLNRRSTIQKHFSYFYKMTVDEIEVIIRTTQKHNNTPCRESKWFPAFFMPTSENGTEMTCFCD